MPDDLRAHVRHIAAAAGCRDHADTLADLTLATFVLVRDGEGRHVAQLGGDPSLPARTSWPQRRDGAPLSFLGALNLDALAADVAAHEPHARLHGQLLIFVAPDDLLIGFGGDEQRVIDRDDMTLIHLPANADADLRGAPSGARVWPAATYTVSPAMPTLPDGDSQEAQDAFGVSSAGQLCEVAQALDPEERLYGAHRLLGWATPVQNDPRLFAPSQENWTRDPDAHLRLPAMPAHPGAAATPEQLAAHVERIFAVMDERERLREQPGYGMKQGSGHPWATASHRGWRLLATFSSDDHHGWMWGDCGELYLLIREDDLRAGRFDRVFLTWQCS